MLLLLVIGSDEIIGSGNGILCLSLFFGGIVDKIVGVVNIFCGGVKCGGVC